MRGLDAARSRRTGWSLKRLPALSKCETVYSGVRPAARAHASENLCIEIPPPKKKKKVLYFYSAQRDIEINLVQSNI